MLCISGFTAEVQLELTEERGGVQGGTWAGMWSSRMAKWFMRPSKLVMWRTESQEVANQI